ncbi:MAG TPA: neutral zinc metallopeptidase [Acidimicrobiia bacterium]|nr:neutral zinc metallopeptidase [Acidimicrobiia bacterium]
MHQRPIVLVMVAAVFAAAVVAAVPAGATRADASAYQPVVNAAIADLQAYWSKEFPQLYGGTYKPVGQVIAADANTKIPDCQGQKISYAKDVKGNAFYCLQSNFIVYDNQLLFPALSKNFTNFAPALVLAHEWGHAIQDRGGITRPPYPQVLLELQADCFAGTWMKRVANGESNGVRFVGGDLDNALAAYLTIRDSVGATPNDNQAHGDAFDRVNAFQTGYDSGPTACKSFVDSPPLITEQTFTNAQDAATGGNLPAAQVLPVTMELLNETYAQVAPDVPALTIDHVFKFNSSGPTSQYPKCPGTLAKKDIQNRVLFCLNSTYIAFDEPLLDKIYKKIGDFGVATLIADTYATYVQFKQNFPGVQDNTINAVLGADCYSGAWAQAVQKGLPSKTLNGDIVSLSPGDLDKAIQAFITYDTARGVSAKSDFVFRRVEAFRKGFFSDFNTCTQTYANASTSLPSG